MADIKIYDISTDEMRNITQQDVDNLQLTAQCFVILCAIARKLTLVERNKDHFTDWKAVRKRLQEIENNIT